jgi:hypothetical protein
VGKTKYLLLRPSVEEHAKNVAAWSLLRTSLGNQPRTAACIHALVVVAAPSLSVGFMIFVLFVSGRTMAKVIMTPTLSVAAPITG